MNQSTKLQRDEEGQLLLSPLSFLKGTKNISYFDGSIIIFVDCNVKDVKTKKIYLKNSGNSFTIKKRNSNQNGLVKNKLDGLLTLVYKTNGPIIKCPLNNLDLDIFYLKNTAIFYINSV